MSAEQEFELGVPFPGRVQPGDRWTCAQWRDDGKPIDWERVFGRQAPRVVDLGCGTGRYLIGSAVARPDHDHLGIDVVPRVVECAAHRAGKRALTNARFAVGDAVPWLFERLASGSVDELHIYHPQPYYKPAEKGRRILTPGFFERAWQVVRPGGLFILQTDHKAYGRHLLKAASKHFDPRVLRGPWPDAPEGRTRREIIARRKGMVVWRMESRRREVPLEIEVPPLDFDAGRPCKRLI